MNVPNLNELARFYVSALCLGASIKRQGQSFLQSPQVDFHVFNAIICCFFPVSGKFPTGRCCSDAWLVQHNLPPSRLAVKTLTTAQPLYSTVQLQIHLQNCKTQQRMKLNTLGLTRMKYTIISQVSLFKHLIYCKTFSTRRR